MGRTRARLVGACDEDFDRMPFRDHGRHCARCDRVVVDLRRATAVQIEALRPLGGVCARVRADAEGIVIAHEPPPVPLRRAAQGVALAMTIAACEPSLAEPSPSARASEVMPAPTPPAIDLGPPMLPIDAMPDAGAPDAGGACDDSAAAIDADPEPTDEQRALTRRKRRRHAPGPSVPPHDVPDLGFVVFDD